jgi:hypothetical protein
MSWSHLPSNAAKTNDSQAWKGSAEPESRFIPTYSCTFGDRMRGNPGLPPAPSDALDSHALSNTPPKNPILVLNSRSEVT